MFREFVKTLVGGAIGLAALYAVAKVAYRAGYDMAELERQYNTMNACEKGGIEKKDSGKSEEVSQNQESTEASSALIELCHDEEEKTTASKSGLFSKIRNGFRQTGNSGKVASLRTLFKHPEAHRLEAYMDGEDIHINIKKRSAFA